MTDNDTTTKLIDRLAEDISGQRMDDDAVTAATDRVWAKLQSEFTVDTPLRSCSDVQSLLPAFVAGELPEAKALLVGDHTRECVPCRRALLELRSGPGRTATPGFSVRPSRTMPSWLKAAAAVLLMVTGGWVAYVTGGNFLADRQLTAQVDSTDGSLQMLTDHRTSVLAAGDTVRAGQRLRTSKDSGAFLRLADGSLIEMAPRSELVLHGTSRGTDVELGRGNIIVHAAEQGRGRLGVTTNECQVTVRGTIFAVNHGLKGSRVSVIEGEVEVRYGHVQSFLQPGEQVTTDERLRRVAIEDEIAWSVNAEEHQQLLRELTQLQHEVARAVDIAAPRTSTRLLDLSPADTVVYVAMPNLTEGLGAARQIFSSRLAESEVLRDWWQREIVDKNIDAEIEESLDRLQFVGEAVGDEVVVALSASALSGQGAPLILAELEDPQGFRSMIEDHLLNHPDGPPPVQLIDHPQEELFEGVEFVIWVADDLVAAAASIDAIRDVADRIEEPSVPGFADTDLHQRLTDRYATGVEWLFGVDLEQTFAEAAVHGSDEEAAMMERVGLLDATTLVFERHRVDVGSAIDGEVRFSGARRGVAAWLAEPAPLATLDFVSQDAYLVSAVAAKDGVELFDELLGMVAEAGPEAITELENVETQIGIDLRDDLAAAIGGEGTFAMDGPLLPVPTWTMILEVYDPATLQHAVEQVVARANTELTSNGGQPVTVRVEEIGDLIFTSLEHPSSPVKFTYTMTDGFLVAGASRAAIERAIQVRDSGMGIAQSAVFRELLPDNGFTDCSALLYRNLAPIFGMLPAGAMGENLGAYEDLLRESAAPGLYCVYGLSDRILVAGTGPSLAALAPILGMQSLMGIDRIVDEVVDEADVANDQEQLSSLG